MDKIRIYIALLFYLTLSFIHPVQAQDMNGSSIVSRAKLQSRGTRYLEQHLYDNGLGDVVREVQSYSGTSFPDIIINHEYDQYRRKTKTWQPVTSSQNSGYLGDNIIANMAETQYQDNAPFSLTVYDNFLVSQPSAQFKAGSEWHNKNKKVSISYSDTVMVDMYMTYYNELGTDTGTKYFCTRYIDEDGSPRAEYADVKGRLKIIETSQGKTYYVYNNKGDIGFVIPPALSEYLISNIDYDVDDLQDFGDMMHKYAYIYRYDYKRNCIYKKLPGCEPIYYIYDKAGNCIFTQDGNQRLRGEWGYSIPDKFGRPAISGICHNSIPYSLDSMQQSPLSVHVYAEYDGSSASLGGYAVRNFSLDSQTLYSACYYDDYSFIGHHGVPSSLTSSPVSGFSIDSSLGKGLQTGSVMALLNENGVAGYTYSAIYYDSRYNVSQTVATNHLGRVDITSTKYSYTGKPTNISINHNLRARGEKEYYTYTYDGADRLSKVTHKLDNSSETSLQQNSYNGLGQLTGTTNSVFATSYAYDIHSWLKRIYSWNQSALFEENLKYADSDNPCYNGNISAMTWQNNGSTTQRYDYIYDNASRLVSSSYTSGSNSNRYNTLYSYDCMGNITSLSRNGLLDDGSYGLIDDLTLTYDGNQLMAVSDDGDAPTYNNAWNFMDGSDSEIEYEYDANGNVTKDLNRNILSIQYNSLNLPSVIEFVGGKTIKYTYSADGHKLRAVYTTVTPATTKQIDYCGNLIFENGQLKQMLFEGGYIPMDDMSGAYCFYVKDHLGNNRMVVHPSGTVEQVNNFYPYGGLMSNSTGWNTQRYKYNGKEFDRMHGLDWYDYGARWMDAAIGRWHVIDPLCEKYYNVSPYAYCAGDPVNAIDPDGKSFLTKVLKATIRISARVASNGLRELGKAATYAEAVSDIQENTSTVVDGNASTIDRIGAGVSLASELLPVSVGDVKGIGDFVKSVNGNSKLSTLAQHIYRIFDKATNKTVKVGISGGKVTKNGKSYRAQKQVRSFNKTDLEKREFDSEIIDNVPAGEGARSKALEKEYSIKYKYEIEKKYHKRP